jgi:hypothetical protein
MTLNDVGFEVITAVTVKSAVFCVAMPKRQAVYELHGIATRETVFSVSNK